MQEACGVLLSSEVFLHHSPPANLSNVTVRNVHGITSLDDLNTSTMANTMAELEQTFDLYITVYDEKLFTPKIYDTLQLQ